MAEAQKNTLLGKQAVLDGLPEHPALTAILNWNAGALTDAKFDRNELTLTVPADQIPAACEALRSGGYNFFEDMTAVDWLPMSPRFQLSYHLLSHARKERIRLCEVCSNLADEPRCRICQDPRRDRTLICVVEEPGDVIPLERTHEFHGLYHVLGGALSPIDGVDPEDLKIEQLYARLAGGGGADASAGADADTDDAVAVREVVLATNPTTTGEATALHIAQGIRERAPHVTVTRLASGLPVGADLEYADEVTLGKALAGRRAV